MMKKILAATLFAGLFASAGAFAGGSGGGAAATATPITLAAATFVPVGDVGTDINLARQYRFNAIANRAGFVKNSFDGTLSANVIAGVFDNAANSRFGVVAASNKGYNVFTGSSVGGSIAQCGAQVEKTVANLGASLVVAGTLNLANANGCARTP